MQADPLTSREALYQLAVSQRRERRVPEAIATLKRLEQAYPPFGGLFEELGLCLLAVPDNAAGRQALSAFERAVDLNPCLPESWGALQRLYQADGRAVDERHAANQLAQLGRLPAGIRVACGKFFDGEPRAAEDLIREYLAENGEHVEALRLLAKLAADAGADHDAERLLQRVVALQPDHEAGRHELALLLFKRQKHPQAREQISQLPNHPRYRLLAAEIAAGMGDYDVALPLYQQLLRDGGNDRALYLSIGNALKTTGKTREAIDAYRFVATDRAGCGEGFWALANLKTYRFSDSEIALMRRHESRTTTSMEDRIHLCFALGKALEDRERYADAFAFYEKGNALQRSRIRYRPEALERDLRARMAREPRPDFGCASDAPIFIVGLPRSGSTLVEQILAAHSQVDGTLELPHIPRMASEIGKLSSGLGEQYLRDTAPYRGDKARFTDKMPNNFRHIHLIASILPNAKIIDVRREPMACGFAIFKQLFATGQRFAYSLEDIGRYYRLYVEVMAHWDEVLPGKILRVRYEDLVQHLDSSVRRMLDFCGLPFEPGCVEFHRKRRTVHTPSSEQVHQPLFKDGLDCWRHFEPWLEPLRRALA